MPDHPNQVSQNDWRRRDCPPCNCDRDHRDDRRERRDDRFERRDDRFERRDDRFERRDDRRDDRRY